VSLVNLIANRLVVKELLGYKATVESLTHELNMILNHPEYRDKMLTGYQEVKRTLGTTGAPSHAATAILDALRKKE
jgi:lipid-A-disaccharide synthase